MKTKLIIASAWMLWATLVAGNAYANPNSETPGVISCQVRLTFKSEALASERNAECGRQIRKCNKNGFYEIQGPMTTIVADFKQSYGRVSFDVDGQQKGLFDGDFWYDYSYNHEVPYYSNPVNPEVLYLQIKLRDSRPNMPIFEATHGPFSLGIPMRVGDEMKIGMSQIAPGNLKIKQTHGDDELMEVAVMCKRNS